MPQEKALKEVKNPTITARYLADYMASSERAKRTIIYGCKYPVTARVLQHTEAKAIVSNFLQDTNAHSSILGEKAKALRERLADDDFERDLYDVNADFVDRFAEIFPDLVLPDAERLPANHLPQITLNGVIVKPQAQFCLRKHGRNNKIKIGAVSFRYAKNKPLDENVAAWQSAFMHGYHCSLFRDDGAEPDKSLCLTLDAYTGRAYPAPGDAVTRFKNMEAACLTIAERWPNIQH